jgi:hypothetical protein
MKTWYEIFIDLGEEIGTHTVDSFDTLEEAIFEYKKLRAKFPKDKYGIDKWVDREDFSEPIEDCTPRWDLI